MPPHIERATDRILKLLDNYTQRAEAGLQEIIVISLRSEKWLRAAGIFDPVARKGRS